QPQRRCGLQSTTCFGSVNGCNEISRWCRVGQGKRLGVIHTDPQVTPAQVGRLGIKQWLDVRPAHTARAVMNGEHEYREHTALQAQGGSPFDSFRANLGFVGTALNGKRSADGIAVRWNFNY